MAFSASPLDGISTNPNPFDSPLNLSIIRRTSAISPNDSKASLKSLSVTSLAKLPT
jgi:hypothetical protein